MTDSKYAVAHRVTFVLPYATLTTVVYAVDEDEAFEKANHFIRDEYGWQPDMFAQDIDVEREEQ